MRLTLRCTREGFADVFSAITGDDTYNGMVDSVNNGLQRISGKQTTPAREPVNL